MNSSPIAITLQRLSIHTQIDPWIYPPTIIIIVSTSLLTSVCQSGLLAVHTYDSSANLHPRRSVLTTSSDHCKGSHVDLGIHNLEISQPELLLCNMCPSNYFTYLFIHVPTFYVHCKFLHRYVYIFLPSLY